MEVVREITVEDDVSDIEYSTFEAEENSGSVQHIQKEIQSEIFATLHLRSIEEDSSPRRKLSVCTKCSKISVQLVLVAIIWAAVSVPSIYYAINSRSKGSTTGEFTNSTAIYNGGACRSALSCLLQEMDLLPNNGIICISSAVDQGETEANAKLLLSLLHKTVDTRCQLDQVRPFACLFLFPLASSCNSSRDNPDPVQIYRPSKKSCEHIRDELCPKTWQRFSISARVDCNTLPSSGLDLNEPSCTESNNSMPEPAVVGERNCTENFMLTNGTCVPRCQVWSAYSSRVVKITDAIIVFSAIFCLLASIAVLILGCCRCKIIYSYPSIFIIYQIVPLVILAALVLVGYSARTRLFCRSSSLIDSINNVSRFCFATGVVFHYFVMQLPFWWICHVIAVFVNTLFPYQVRRIECMKRLRCLHVFMVLAGILLPMGSMAAVATTGGFQLTHFPTYLCVGTNKDVIYAVMILPTTVTIGLGTTLMLLILSTVIKRHIQAHVYHLRVRLNWTTEAKVFLVLIYYLTVGSVIIFILTKGLIGHSEFITAVQNYFSCEASGTSRTSLEGDASRYYNYSTCDSYREKVNKLAKPYGLTTALVLLGLYPTVYLVYTINCKDLRDVVCTRNVREVVEPKTSTTSRKKMDPHAYYPQLGGNSSNNRFNTSYPPESTVDAYARPSTFTPPSM